MKEGSREEQEGRITREGYYKVGGNDQDSRITREEGRSRSRSKGEGRWWKAEEVGKTG